MRSATWRVIEIRALRECDDRSQFHPGDPDLDRFIHKFAGENPSRHDVAVTCVAAGHRGILGFAKLAPGRIEFEGLPAPSRKMLPRYPCPRFGRLVLRSTSRHALEGLGTQRLGLVLKLSVRMANDN